MRIIRSGVRGYRAPEVRGYGGPGGMRNRSAEERGEEYEGRKELRSGDTRIWSPGGTRSRSTEEWRRGVPRSEG